MSDKHKNRDDRMKDIRRYLDGKMSGSERNSFEKKLQADPFEDEALEGLKGLSADEMNVDIRSLRSSLKGRVRRRTPLYYRIAAAVVVLLAISSLLMLRELNKPEILVSDNITIEKDTLVELASEPELIYDESIEEPEKTEQSKNILSTDAAKEEKPADETEIIEMNRFAVVEEDIPAVILDDKVELDVYDTLIMEQETRITEPEGVITREKSEKGEAMAYVTEERKVSATRAKKAAETDPLVRAEEKVVGEVAGISIAEEAEVVEDQVLDYAEADVDIETASDAGAEPYGGMKEFKKYLQTDQVFPEGWDSSDKEVVRLEITVEPTGKIEDIKIIKSPDKSFSDEATRLIKEGPPWKAALKDSKAVSETKDIRIVFRR